jgi:Xaa-Pro dipeptidase
MHMKDLHRIKEVARLMSGAPLDALIVGPNTDLAYLTGLTPLSDERFKALVILKDGRFFHICPELYEEETREALGAETDVFVWSDTDGFLGATQAASQSYHLDHMTIGVNDAVRAVDLLSLGTVTTAKFVIGSSVLEEVRACKDSDERGFLREAARLADEVAVEILPFIHAGAVEGDVKKRIGGLFAAKGVPELAFETIVASGPNSSRPHYTGGERVITDHDIVVLDFGCRYHGYCSDTSRMVFVGEPTEEQRKIYDIVLKANLAGERAAGVGATAGDVDGAARDVIEAAGYGANFLNRTGHGIGMADHEAPYIRHGNPMVLQEGMAFSVEPGIYLAGRFGMRVEDIVLIEDGKADVLNRSPKGLVIL